MSSNVAWPRCSNCDYFSCHEEWPQSGHCCRKHRFVMPEVGVEVVCHDWRHRGQTSAIADALPAGSLCYYSSASPAPPQVLGALDDLQHPILDARVHWHESRGWTLLFLSTDDPVVPLFPEPGDGVRLVFGDTAYAFVAADMDPPEVSESAAERSPAHPRLSQIRAHRLLYNPDVPTALYDWLNHCFDLTAYQSELRQFGSEQFVRYLLAVSLYVFLEVMLPQREYRLLPDYSDLLAKFRRN